MPNPMRIAVAVETRLRGALGGERGEGIVSFLIIVVAVAALALVVWAFVEEAILDKTAQLDMGEPPSPTVP